jgi:hypothetical protein
LDAPRFVAHVEQETRATLARALRGAIACAGQKSSGSGWVFSVVAGGLGVGRIEGMAGWVVGLWGSPWARPWVRHGYGTGVLWTSTDVD